VTFAEEFIAQAETRAGKPGSSPGAIFLQTSLPGKKIRAPEDILPREPANPLPSAYPFRVRRGSPQGVDDPARTAGDDAEFRHPGKLGLCFLLCALSTSPYFRCMPYIEVKTRHFTLYAVYA
jgi:hypothetical protein